MTLKTTKSTEKRPLPLYIGGAVLVIAAILAIVLMGRAKSDEVEAETHVRANIVAAGPRVRVVTPTLSEARSSITLEGDALPYASTTLYAKIGGYLKRIIVDKGDEVKQGQELAFIECPEVDQQYQGAVADAANKAVIAGRNKALLAKDLVSAQTADQSLTDAEIAKQTLAVLTTQRGYEVIKAPFAGRITGRYVDPGALIQNAVNQETTTQPLVSISDVNRLRVEVYVDQRYAAFVHVGDPVEVTVPERPGFSLKAKVTRFTGELDAQSRMQLVEIEVSNRDRQIVPGSMVNVSLSVALAAHLEIPVEALVVKKDKFFVPVVDSQNEVSFRQIHIGANDGKTIEVLDGLKGDEHIVINLGNGVTEGSHVQPTNAVASS